MRICFLFTLALLALSCGGTPNNSNVNAVNISKANVNSSKVNQPLPVYTYEIVKAYPHDPKAFTEGLFFHDGFLYESTGEKGRSSLRKVDLETGKILQNFDLPRESFGEGISLVNGKIYQLTWQEGLCRVFDAKDFSLIREFQYQGEGWGMTTDGTNLYMTDRTHVIRVMDPETFRPVRMISVFREDGKPLYQVNELEWIKGEIWANVWHSEDPRILGKPNHIARIDPATGKLLGWIDLQGISPDDQPKSGDPDDDKAENTLNGIAYDAAADRIFVTGKNWKKLYEIKVKPKEAS
jgi:glutaminyl-peptide cyclotransferase